MRELSFTVDLVDVSPMAADGDLAAGLVISPSVYSFSRWTTGSTVYLSPWL